MSAATAALALLAAAAMTPRAALDATLRAAEFHGVVLAGTGAAPDYARARGLAPSGPPLAAESRWRWASVTKQLTALIVMQEVAAGRLTLDQAVRAYWPDWQAPYADAITIRMLLQHDSGLADPASDTPDSEGVPHFYRAQGAAALPASSADGFCAARPRAAPGSGYHYNNCDYIVLGALLERVTGKSLATLFAERIATPIGAHSIGLFAADQAPPPQVIGYDHGRREPRVNYGVYGGAGSAYGSPADLYRFDRALLDHRLLDGADTSTMWAPDPALGQAALGAWTYQATLAGCGDPVTIVERRGQIGGVQIRNFLVPAQNFALVAFTNRAELDFGAVGDGKGMSYRLLSAALCGAMP